MQKSGVNLQDVFLNQIRKDATMVTIHLCNGFQIKGLVKGFDNFVILIDTEGKQMMVYKHAVSTITPQKTVTFNIQTGE
ncbi:MAG: RNA chaperone Hfq [Eubacteriales bacterium]